MSASSRSYKRKTDELDGINPLACSSMDTWNTGSSLKKPSSTWETGTMNFGGWTPNTDPRLAGSAAAGSATPSAEQMSAYNAFLQMQMMQMMNPAMAMMNPGMMMNAQNLAAMSVMQTAGTGATASSAAVDKNQKPVTKAPLTYGEYKRLQRMKSDPSYNPNEDYPSNNHSYNRSSSMEGYRTRRDSDHDIKQERDDPRYPVVDIRERELQKQLELQRLQLERQQQQLLLQQQQLLQLQEKQKQVLLTKPGEADEWDDIPRSSDVRHSAREIDEDFGRDRRGRERDIESPLKRIRSRSKSRDRDDHPNYDRRRRGNEWNDDDRRNRGGRGFGGNRGRFNRFDSRDDRRYRDDDRRERDRDFGRNRGGGRSDWRRNGDSPPKKTSRFSREEPAVKIKQEEDWDDDGPSAPPPQQHRKPPVEDNWDNSPPKTNDDNDFWNTQDTQDRSRDRGRFNRRDERRPDRGRKDRWGDREPRKTVQEENWDDEEIAPKPWGDSDRETAQNNHGKNAGNDKVQKLIEENWDDEEIEGPAKWVEPVAPKPVEQDDEEDWDKEEFGPQNEWIDRPADLPAITDELLNVKPEIPIPVVDNNDWEEEEKKLAEKRKALAEENWDDDDEPLVEEPWTTVVNPGVKLIEGTKAVIINGDMYLAPANPVLKPVPPPMIQSDPVPDDFDWDEAFYPPDWDAEKRKEKNMQDSMECVEMEIVENEEEEQIDENVVPPGLSEDEFENLKLERLKMPAFPPMVIVEEKLPEIEPENVELLEAEKITQVEDEIEEEKSEEKPDDASEDEYSMDSVDMPRKEKEIVDETSENNEIEKENEEKESENEKSECESEENDKEKVENKEKLREKDKEKENDDKCESEEEKEEEKVEKNKNEEKKEKENDEKIQENEKERKKEEIITITKEYEAENEEKLKENQKTPEKSKKKSEKEEKLKENQKTPEKSRKKSEKEEKEKEESDNESVDFDWDIEDFGSPSKFIQEDEKTLESERVIVVDDDSNDAPATINPIQVANIKKEIKQEPDAEEPPKDAKKIPDIPIKIEKEIEIKSEIEIEARKISENPGKKKDPIKEVYNDEQIKSELEIGEFRMTHDGETVEEEEIMLWEDANVATEVELGDSNPIEEEQEINEEKKPQKSQGKTQKAPPKKRRRRKAWTTKRKRKPAAKKNIQKTEEDKEEEEDEEEQGSDDE